MAIWQTLPLIGWKLQHEKLLKVFSYSLCKISSNQQDSSWCSIQPTKTEILAIIFDYLKDSLTNWQFLTIFIVTNLHYIKWLEVSKSKTTSFNFLVKSQRWQKMENGFNVKICCFWFNFHCTKKDSLKLTETIPLFSLKR